MHFQKRRWGRVVYTIPYSKYFLYQYFAKPHN